MTKEEFDKLEILLSDATHTRDGDFYRVTNKVQYFEHQEWFDCKDCFDLSGWLDELEPLNTADRLFNDG